MKTPGPPARNHAGPMVTLVKVSFNSFRIIIKFHCYKR